MVNDESSPCVVPVTLSKSEINDLIEPSGRQFECAVDGNFALVVCLTAEQKARMQAERGFPFAT